MRPCDRRTALHAAATGLATALAGCSGSSSVSSTATASTNSGRPVTDYEEREVRDENGTPVIEVNEESLGREEDQVSEYLTGEKAVSKLTFADTEAGRSLRSFVTGTDYESESILLFQQRIDDCYELVLESVSRGDDSIDVSFCDDLRPADYECSAEKTEVVATAIRLPFPGDSISGHGTNWSSSCPDERDRTRGVAEASGSGSSSEGSDR